MQLFCTAHKTVLYAAYKGLRIEQVVYLMYALSLCLSGAGARKKAQELKNKSKCLSTLCCTYIVQVLNSLAPSPLPLVSLKRPT